jgi:hypothetical protein
MCLKFNNQVGAIEGVLEKIVDPSSPIIEEIKDKLNTITSTFKPFADSLEHSPFHVLFLMMRSGAGDKEGAFMVRPFHGKEQKLRSSKDFRRLFSDNVFGHMYKVTIIFS